MTVRKPETCKHFVDLGTDGIRWVLKVLLCSSRN